MYQSLKTGLQADGVYGEIHVHDNVVSQSIPTNAVVYTKLIEWSDNGESKGTIPDQANGQITLSDSGIYKLESTLSFKSGTGNVVTECSIFIDGVEQDQLHFTRKISTAGDVGSASITGLASVDAGQVIDLRLKHDNAGSVDITVVYGNLNAEYVNT